MGSQHTYWIIVFDGFGIGLNLINPRIYTENGLNWFTYQGGEHEYWGEHICAKHSLTPDTTIIHWSGDEPKTPNNKGE